MRWRLLCLSTLACGLGCAGDDAPRRLYVASGFSDQVFVLDSETGALLDSLALNPRRGEVDEPHGVAVSPDGSHWYATVSHGEPTLWKYEAVDDRLVGRVTLPTRGAARIRISPDGRRGFVPDYYRSGMGVVSDLAVVDLTTLRVERTLPVCAAPHDAAVDPSGELLAVACALSDEVVVLDAQSLDERWRVPAGPEAGPPGAPHYKPLNVAWHPNGQSVYVGLHASAEVVRLGLDGQELGRTATPPGPTQLAMAPQGLVVANRGRASLSILDPVTLTERQRIVLEGAHPHGLDVDVEAGRAYVSSEGAVDTPGTVSVVDLDTGELVWTRTLGTFLVGVALGSG